MMNPRLLIPALFCTLLLTLMISSLPALADENGCLRLGVQDQPVHRIVSGRISVALTEKDICHTIIFLPPRRITRELLQGRIDGELLRYDFYAEKVGDVAEAVPEKLFHLDGLLISWRTGLRKLEDVGEFPVGLILGNSWGDHERSRLKNVETASDAEQMLKMLNNNRTYAVLLNSAEWENLQPKFPNLHSEVIRDLSVYLYLAKNKSKWREPVAEAIRAYKASDRSFLPTRPAS